MRLYRGKIETIAEDVIRTLKEQESIELESELEARQDIEAVLKEYLRLEREIVDDAKNRMEVRGLGYSQLGKVKSQVSKERGALGYVEAIRKSKDPTTFTVLVEDSVALLGLAIAFVGIFASQLFDDPRLDGVASIGIGILLAATAMFLARPGVVMNSGLVNKSWRPSISHIDTQCRSAEVKIAT